MRSAAFLIACIAVLLLFAASCPAQSGASAAEPEAPAKASGALKHRSAAVAGEPLQTTIDLLVRDRKGRPVTDLTPADILITDGGKAVQLTSLRPGQGAETGDRLVAFVFGQMSASAAKSARESALSILKSFPDRGYAYAVLGVDGRLRLFTRYTSDRSEVRDAINTLTRAQPADWQAASTTQEKQLIVLAGESPEPAAANNPGATQARAMAVLTALKQSQRLVVDRHDAPDVAALIAICTAQQKLAGRKALLYFGQSTQVDVNTLDEYHVAIRAANQSSTSIYAMDMNALDSGASDAMLAGMSLGSARSSTSQTRAPASGSTAGYHSLLGAAQATAMNDTITNIEFQNNEGTGSALGELAAQTGGLYTGFSGGVRKLSKQLLSDLNHYYQASYSFPAELYDGSYRPISVKSLRRGVVIHAPSGYLALPPNQNLAVSMLDSSLVHVFEHPAASHTLPFRAATLDLGQTAAGSIREFVVEVPLESLDIREDPNSDLYAYHLKVAARIETQDGKVVQEFSGDIHHRGRLDTVDADRKGAVAFQRHAVLLAGDYRLMAAVVDANSASSGFTTQPFQVPPASSGHLLSELVLVRRTERAPAADETELDLLRYGATEIVPDLSGMVAAGTREATIFLSAQAQNDDASPVTVSITKDGQPVGRPTSLHAVSESHHYAKSEASTSSSPVSAYMGTLALKSFPPGRYQVSAKYQQGQSTEERHLSLRLAPVETTADLAAAVPATPGEEAPTLSPEGALSPAVSLSTEHTPNPAVTEQWIAAARKRALGYQGKLPNFMCLESIERLTDRAGRGRWTHRDTITELLTYRDKKESRVLLKVNGREPDAEHNTVRGPRSNGEYGGLLQAIFDPAVEAHFEWQGETQTGGNPLQVFRYRVAQNKSAFSLTDANLSSVNAAIHGVISVEPATGAVRSVGVQADDLPAKFSIHASSISLDYDYVSINGHDYLVPVRGEVSLKEGKHREQLNRLQFRDYHRFASQSRILSYKPVEGSE